MKRLHLIIVTAALLPSLAVVWSRYDERSERAADAALACALAQRSALFMPSKYECEEWLEHHGNHPLAAELRRILTPAYTDQIGGTAYRARALAAFLGNQSAEPQK
jgi:hypothetical protein